MTYDNLIKYEKNFYVDFQVGKSEPDKDGNYNLLIERYTQQTQFQFDNRQKYKREILGEETHNISENYDIMSKLEQDYKTNSGYCADMNNLRAEYDKWVKSFDLTPAQDEYFKNSKMRDSNNNLVPCYHFTNHTFDAFDKDKITEDSYCGSGFYFTSRNDFGGGFGHNKLECYLNIEKPLIIEQMSDYEKEEAFKYFSDTDDYKNGYVPRIEGYPQKGEKYSSHRLQDMLEYYEFDDPDVESLRIDVINSSEYQYFLESGNIEDLDYCYEFENLKDEQEFKDAIEERGLTEYLDMEILKMEDMTYRNFHYGDFNEFAKQLTEYAKDYGYDAIILDMNSNGHATEIVVFEPNQIKAVDNLYPTKSDNFRDNSKEYMKEHKPSTLKDKIKEAKSKQSDKTYSNEHKHKTDKDNRDGRD